MSTFTRNCLEKGTAEGALAQLFRQRSRNREEIVNNLPPKNKQENLKNYSTDVNYFLKNTVRLNNPSYPEFVKTGLSDKTVIGFSLRVYKELCIFSEDNVCIDLHIIAFIVHSKYFAVSDWLNSPNYFFITS